MEVTSDLMGEMMASPEEQNRFCSFIWLGICCDAEESLGRQHLLSPRDDGAGLPVLQQQRHMIEWWEKSALS